MRMIVILLAVLTVAKVWTQDRFYRAAMGDALVQAYRERAANSCQQKQQGKAAPPAAAAWTPATPAEAVIGNAYANVAFWDYQNPLWDVRFRHPHLVLNGSGGRCAFDLVLGFASITPL